MILDDRASNVIAKALCKNSEPLDEIFQLLVECFYAESGSIRHWAVKATWKLMIQLRFNKLALANDDISYSFASHVARGQEYEHFDGHVEVWRSLMSCCLVHLSAGLILSNLSGYYYAYRQLISDRSFVWPTM